MSPVVNGKWYATTAEGYADSPFFKGEVTECVHRNPLGKCDECKRIMAAQEEERRAEWDRIDALLERRRNRWWRRLLR